MHSQRDLVRIGKPRHRGGVWSDRTGVLPVLSSFLTLSEICSEPFYITGLSFSSICDELLSELLPSQSGLLAIVALLASIHDHRHLIYSSVC